jgi:hypothetical protein
LVRWAGRAGTRDCYPALTALVGIVQNMFFLSVPSPSNLGVGGRQSCRAACLRICISSGNREEEMVSEKMVMRKKDLENCQEVSFSNVLYRYKEFLHTFTFYTECR